MARTDDLLEKILAAIKEDNSESGDPGPSLPSSDGGGGGSLKSKIKKIDRIAGKTANVVNSVGRDGDIGGGISSVLGQLVPGINKLIESIDSLASQTFEFQHDAPQQRVIQMAVEAARKGVILDKGVLAQVMQQQEQIGLREKIAYRNAIEVTNMPDIASGAIQEATGIDIRKKYREGVEGVSDFYYDKHFGRRQRDARLQGLTVRRILPGPLGR